MGSGPSTAVSVSAFAEKSQRRFGELSDFADSDLPERLAQDGRLLADFALFLHEGHRHEELLDLWALDLACAGNWSESEEAPACISFGDRRNTIRDCCCKLVENLERAWEEYQASPEGLGNFDDTREWMPHDFPDDAILQKINSDDPQSVSKDHANYAFSIAAMVGIHVSVVCSDLVSAWASEAAGITEGCTDAFHRRVPKLDLQSCLQEQIRVFPVPPNGSAYSPQTCLDKTFHMEEFAPRLFAQVRRLTGVSSESYFESVCRTDFQFIAFGTNSKSGELFFFTYDQKYLIKTTSELEAKTLLRMLPRYLERLEEEPRSMLGRYMGLYRVSMEGEQSRLFFVMRSVTTHELGICHTYDIKGSFRNRKAKQHEAVGKDLNFDEEMGSSLNLPPDIAAEVAEVHEGDLELLQEFRIMDFSLLVQIHDTSGTFGSAVTQQCSVRLDKKAKRRWRDSLPLLNLRSSRRKHSRRQRSREMSNSNGSRRLDGHQVQVRAGTTAGAWTRQGTLSQLPESPTSPLRPKWVPHDGSLVRLDGTMKYTMGLIDMLVPFTAYPKMQYVGMEVITCGRGTESSRVPPDFYCERQIEKVHAMCDQE
ncbi:unnamed protein product, partial [Durusdinium trenchii]